jgi:hypothetical protein
MKWLVLALAACSAPAKRDAVGNTTGPTPAKPAAIAVQLTYKGTFMIGPPFSRPPPFTLLDDGTLIGATEDAQLYTAKLSGAEVARIIKRVRDLGFDRLEDHLDSCKRTGNVSMCVSDASFTILRVARPDGTLREVTTYGGFSNDEKAHDAIVDYLSKYKPASSAPYRPAFGVVHVNVDTTPAKPPCSAIDPAMLNLETAKSTMWATEIRGAALDKVLAIAGGERKFDACAAEVLFHLTFVPGVPGMDIAGELEPYKRHE